jgi:hypothetical protein
VIAAWLFCLAVVGAFLIFAPVTGGMVGPAIQAHAVSTRPAPTFFCRTRINRDDAQSPWRQNV